MMNAIRITCVCCLGLALPVQAHRIAAGDHMPAFTLKDANGVAVSYPSQPPRVWALVMLRPEMEGLEPLLRQVTDMTARLRSQGRPFTCVAVLSDVNSPSLKTRAGRIQRGDVPVLPDPGYHVWGQLGIVAVPTVLVVDAKGVVTWVHPGPSYDLVPALHSELARALGLKSQTLVNGHIKVETLQNETILAKQRRHIQMAKVLLQQGQLKLALTTMHQAFAMDPNAVEVALEWAELLCRSQQAAEALKVLEPLKPTMPQEKGRCLLLTGWAHRQLGQLDQALEALTQAVQMDETGLACYQLGLTYEAKGQLKLALKYYHQALERVFDRTDQPIKSQD